MSAISHRQRKRLRRHGAKAGALASPLSPAEQAALAAAVQPLVEQGVVDLTRMGISYLELMVLGWVPVRMILWGGIQRLVGMMMTEGEWAEVAGWWPRLHPQQRAGLLRRNLTRWWQQPEKNFLSRPRFYSTTENHITPCEIMTCD